MNSQTTLFLGTLLAAITCGAEQAGKPVLLFTIGMHIEPLGITAQGYGRQVPANYANPGFFDKHVADIEMVARIVENHSGRMTVQAQSPFTSAAIRRGNAILAELAARGHEIALHFHEDAHLGPASSSQPAETWCRVLKEEIALLKEAAKLNQIRYWSGGNLYPDLLKAASCAGLSVNSDWKNPLTQSTPLELVGIHPWRPAGGTDGKDVSRFARHDPGGPVVFLPEGRYDRGDFAAARRSVQAGGDKEYFAFLRRMLEASVAIARADRVNVFHFTIHPGEFRGSAGHPFAVIDEFLTEAVDPLVASGRVRWATLSEMADAYVAWEKANPGVDPRSAAVLDRATPAGRPYMTFAINVHDWTRAAESAGTLTRLLDLFERHGVCADFYFTQEITHALAERFPELIERFRQSKMTISYHVRPPHPAYQGFDVAIRSLDDASLARVLLEHETWATDPATGRLDRSRPGGYKYVASVFGRAPAAVSAPGRDPRIRNAAQRVYAKLGAVMTVVYHETGTKSDQPLEFSNGLLIRPSDFSITRVELPSGGTNFWWNLIAQPDGERYHPVRLLEEKLNEWRRRGAARPPFITALIHENDFVRRGPPGWNFIYYQAAGGQPARPLPPPWNLDAHDRSPLRPERERELIWSAYDALASYAAANFTVVTSQDLVAMAARLSR